MLDLIFSFIPGGQLTALIAAVLAGLAALWGYGVKKKREGKADERAKQAAREKAARDVADEVDNDVGAMPPDKRREELKKWSR